MSTATQNTAPTASHFIPGQHFLETFTLLPQTTRTTFSWTTTTFLSSTSKHDFYNTMANISHAHIQQCVNLTMHFSFGHLAAKMPSQLINDFISLLPYFFPSYETCSIPALTLYSMLPLKPSYKNLTASSFFSLFYFPTTFSEDTYTH